VAQPIQPIARPGDALNGKWPQPLGQVVHLEMPRLREAVEEWHRSELEADIEEQRRKDQSKQIKRWLKTQGLGQYADGLRHGRYCGPQALAQLKALPRDEVIQFCETVQRNLTGKNEKLAAGSIADDDDELTGQMPREKNRCCRSRRTAAGGTMTAAFLLVVVTTLGMCSSTTLGCAL
jgi:hypothetical protein